ncbi:uncharacterized protein LOC106754201 [Vigna radiata var. radiata]|uniref:Uncharacterized protein LOC106754201 n=1 Tax=Vigna radiata var. radiata TaxID=3916 RepID=A0A1S3TD47_VIGRR|nr:uncharacterized protein LOC106754201 [Vigna radiata var. radiata]
MDSDEVFVSFSDTVFGFWEDLQEPPEYSTNSSKLLGDDDEQLFSVENDYKAFWEKQYLLLQATLCGSSIEKRVLQATKEVLTELNMWDMQCLCRREVNVKSCRNCLRREICDRLLNLGYNSALCTSKWRTSSEIQIINHYSNKYLSLNNLNSKIIGYIFLESN